MDKESFQICKKKLNKLKRKISPILNRVFVLCLAAQSCSTLHDPTDCSPWGSSDHGDSPGKNTGVGCNALLQGIFQTQGLNPGLPHCIQILYCLRQQGSLRIFEWGAFPFYRGSSGPGNWTGFSCIAGGFFTSWAIKEAWIQCLYKSKSLWSYKMLKVTS